MKPHTARSTVVSIARDYIKIEGCTHKWTNDIHLIDMSAYVKTLMITSLLVISGEPCWGRTGLPGSFLCFLS